MSQPVHPNSAATPPEPSAAAISQPELGPDRRKSSRSWAVALLVLLSAGVGSLATLAFTVRFHLDSPVGAGNPPVQSSSQGWVPQWWITMGTRSAQSTATKSRSTPIRTRSPQAPLAQVGKPNSKGRSRYPLPLTASLANLIPSSLVSPSTPNVQDNSGAGSAWENLNLKAAVPSPATNGNQAEIGIPLTLADAVVLALQGNREIKNAYLQRVIDRQDLAIAEDRFVPNFRPVLTLSIDRNRLGGFSSRSSLANLGAVLTVKLPTGADVNLNWRGFNSTGASNLQPITITGLGNGVGTLGQQFDITVSQPLLRGAGVAVNTAPIGIARLQEDINLLALQATLMDTITQTIQIYRVLLQAQGELEIAQSSLSSSQRQLDVVRAFVEAGRQPRINIVQSEATVAQRQVDLVDAQSRLDAAQLALLNILDLEPTPQNRRLFAVEMPNPEQIDLPETDQLVAIALAQNPGYLQVVQQVAQQELQLVLARNGVLWDLNLNVRYTNDVVRGADTRTDAQAFLSLSRQFGDLQQDFAPQRQAVVLQQARNNLQEAQESLTIAVQNQQRDVRVSFQQVKLATQARILAEQQLDNEREKLRLGLPGARLIDILAFEDRLVAARISELNATIAYLNAVTVLERTLGQTLETWQVQIESRG